MWKFQCQIHREMFKKNKKQTLLLHHSSKHTELVCAGETNDVTLHTHSLLVTVILMTISTLYWRCSHWPSSLLITRTVCGFSIDHEYIMFVGALIDHVMVRGRQAFIEFMTVLEYEYPEIYHEITRCTPRCPPPGMCNADSAVRSDKCENSKPWGGCYPV